MNVSQYITILHSTAEYIIIFIMNLKTLNMESRGNGAHNRIAAPKRRPSAPGALVHKKKSCLATARDAGLNRHMCNT